VPEHDVITPSDRDIAKITERSVEARMRSIIPAGLPHEIFAFPDASEVHGAQSTAWHRRMASSQPPKHK
jgi:hypothetical protein